VTLRAAYDRGARAALAKFANAMGADAGVQPKGDEVSHGTERVPYAHRDAPRDGNTAMTDGAAVSNMPDWLWDHFTTYDRGMAPGRADGSFGQEVIG
jgi:hypothetical protein